MVLLPRISNNQLSDWLDVFRTLPYRRWKNVFPGHSARRAIVGAACEFSGQKSLAAAAARVADYIHSSSSHRRSVKKIIEELLALKCEPPTLFRDQFILIQFINCNASWFYAFLHLFQDSLIELIPFLSPSSSYWLTSRQKDGTAIINMFNYANAPNIRSSLYYI